jgi:hypothetical protein
MDYRPGDEPGLVVRKKRVSLRWVLRTERWERPAAAEQTATLYLTN